VAYLCLGSLKGADTDVSLRRLLFTFGVCVLAFAPGAAARADGGPIMALSDVQPGMNCTGETVVQGVTISSFDVHVIDIVAQPTGPRILVSVSGPAVDSTGVAEGMSGSPVYCPESDGTLANAGAISESVGEYGNSVALVTPIQQMLGEPVLPPSGAPRLTAPTRPLLGPLTVGGLSPALLNVLEQAAQRAGRTIVAGPPSSDVPPFPVQQLVPGASVAVQYSTGTITTGAVGTVTYRDGSTVYAFGHPLDDAGRRSLLLTDGYVYAVINDPNPYDLMPSYKLAAPGHPLGTLTSDTPNAVIGEVGPEPRMIPVDVTAHDLDTGNVIHEQTQVADESSVGFPLGTSMLDTVAPAALGQAAIDVYNGPPASESGHFCMSITISESRRPLGLCKRYVGIGSPGDEILPPELATEISTDAANAFQVLDTVQFGQLHVTKVQATIYAQRGLSEAAIQSASGPRVVKAGHTITVRLRVRMYRGSARTIRFKLRVPRHAKGPTLLKIKGPSFNPLAEGDIASLVTALSGGLGAPSNLPGPPPANLAAVRKQIAAISHYDGVTAALTGSPAVRVYSNPNLLVSGRTTLPLQVVR
jgi:hypothetical protein